MAHHYYPHTEALIRPRGTLHEMPDGSWKVQLPSGEFQDANPEETSYALKQISRGNRYREADMARDQAIKKWPRFLRWIPEWWIPEPRF